MFTPSNMLQNYLNTQPRDMFDIVGALMGYINADPMFKTNDFEQAIQYVLNHGVSKEVLFVAFDSGIEYEEDSTKWNEEYYSYARVYLKDNFCEKRIVHVKAVARKLYPVERNTSSVKPVVSQTTRVNNGESTPKKAKSQQIPAGKNLMPAVAKVAIAVVAMVLPALVISLLLRK